ncbi:MAG: hypothetical protein HY078_16515 [Elusimicrobia bacterium]|nr:hypothetical protein [Elusimicrobiota bacterium]
MKQPCRRTRRLPLAVAALSAIVSLALPRAARANEDNMEVACRYTIRYGDPAKAAVNGKAVVPATVSGSPKQLRAEGVLATENERSLALSVVATRRDGAHWNATWKKATGELLGRFERTKGDEGVRFEIFSIEQGPDVVSRIAVACEMQEKD